MIDQFFHLSQRLRATLSDALKEACQIIVNISLIAHKINQAKVIRLLGLDDLAGEEQRFGPGQPDPAR